MKSTKDGNVAKELIIAPMVTKPTLPYGMCLPTGNQPRGEYLPSRIPSRRGRLRQREVEEEGQQRCLMEDASACNGNKDEESISLTCVTSDL